MLAWPGLAIEFDGFNASSAMCTMREKKHRATLRLGGRVLVKRRVKNHGVI